MKKTTLFKKAICIGFGQKFTALFLFVLSSLNLSTASEIVEVLPLTNKVIMVHFDDGNVVYPSVLTVNRLDVALADNKMSWSLISTNDNAYQTATIPTTVGRKSKGTEFIRDALWAGTSYDPRPKPWASEHWIYLVLPTEMVQGKNYQLNTSTLASNGSSWSFVYDEKTLRSEAVHVNTLGYDSYAPKYGYIYQWMGSLGNLDLSNYNAKSFWVYKDGVEQPVKTGIVNKRKSATNPETDQVYDTPNKNFLGAEVYDCDFSDIVTEGNYKLVVEGIGSSYSFKIGKDAIWDAYYHTARAMYYQRSGIRLAPPYAVYTRPVTQNTKVTSDDGESFAGKLLYSDYSFMDWVDGNGGGTSQVAIRNAAVGKPLDVAGWYHDAGDWDAYWSHQRVPITLMTLWEFAPNRFADNELNIPESGNGIPDLVDEASWLIKFNYRLRKELKAKGYSNGGVGGARVCADVYNSVEGNPESSKPSWKDTRHYVVTKADAFMTYMYAGEAAQLAIILKKVGKDPTNFPVEMLDAVEFSKMSKDNVDWIKEAEEAYAWAAATENQPVKSTNYAATLDRYRSYAATNLYRLTGKEMYNTVAKSDLTTLSSSKSSLFNDDRWGAYVYLLCDNYKTDKTLQNTLKNIVLSTATNSAVLSASKRACRWGGIFDMPMIIGQATTPAVFETMIASCISSNADFSNTVNTTSDYFLGTNPLHTTWMTSVGPRPVKSGFHLDSRYCNNWVNYPGFIPYGPESMTYNYSPYTWVIDGVSMDGGAGPWNKDWPNFSMSPVTANWPGHERWNDNIHAPQSSENTIHQSALYGAVTYGFVNNRDYTKLSFPNKISTISLNYKNAVINKLDSQMVLIPVIDNATAVFSNLKWTSTNPRVAHVNNIGCVTALSSGSCEIICSTLDGLASDTCTILCNWPEIAVISISTDKSTYNLIKGQGIQLNIVFNPTNASNKFVDYTYSETGIVSIGDDGILRALKAGKVTVTATTVNSAKVTTFSVVVNEGTDMTILDFDTLIPVTDSPKPNVCQVFAPGGTKDVAFSNPFICSANSSSKVLKWGRPTGEWKLFGIVLPTAQKPNLSPYLQLSFKYFGSQIKEFYLQITTNIGTTEVTKTVSGENCWKMFVCDISSTDSLKQINIYANKKGLPDPFDSYYDDLRLHVVKPQYIVGSTISDTQLSMQVGDSKQITTSLSGEAFSWISSDINIATVDQDGVVKAVGGGTAQIKAVPLYGDAAICNVTVAGAPKPTYKESVFLDFEDIVFNVNGYAGYGWNSSSLSIGANSVSDSKNNSAKVLIWNRDVSGTPLKLWGGYGVSFPLKACSGWERLSYMVYSTQPVSTIRTELFNSSISLGSKQLDNLNIPANAWTRVNYLLTDFNITDQSMNKIQVQIAGGSSIATMTTYSDNFKLEAGPDPTGIFDLKLNNQVSVFPNPVRDIMQIKSATPMKYIELYTLDGKKICLFNGHNKELIQVNNPIRTKGIYLLKISDISGNTVRSKIIVN